MLFIPFYTSYKGWKPCNILARSGRLFPFYTSYKGWKLQCGVDNRRVVLQLFILPIRDGNISNIGKWIYHIQPFYTSYKGWKLKGVGYSSLK